MVARINETLARGQGQEAETFDAKAILASYTAAIREAVAQASRLGQTADTGRLAQEVASVFAREIQAFQQTLLETVSGASAKGIKGSGDRALQIVRRAAQLHEGGNPEELNYRQTGQGRYFAFRPGGSTVGGSVQREIAEFYGAGQRVTAAQGGRDVPPVIPVATGGGGGGKRPPPTGTTGGPEFDPEEEIPAIERAIQELRKANDLLAEMGGSLEYLNEKLRNTTLAAQLAAENFQQLLTEEGGAGIAAKAGETHFGRLVKARTEQEARQLILPEDIETLAAASRAQRTTKGETAITESKLASEQDKATDATARYTRKMNQIAEELGAQKLLTEEDLLAQAMGRVARELNELKLSGITQQLRQQFPELAAAGAGGRGPTGGGYIGGRRWEGQSNLQRPRGVREILQAAVAGIGGYRSAARLPPGALEGSVPGVLGRGLAGGLSFNLFFALQGGLQRALSEAVQLDKAFGELRDDVNAFGQGSQFNEFRSSILSIAQATGVAGTQVEQLSQIFLGLYGNVTQVADATKAAAQFIEVVGGSAAQTGPQIATIAQNFGITAEQVANASITAGRAGARTPADILGGAAAFAPSAALYGLNANQAFGLIAAASKGSAQSGTEIGTTLDRVLSNLPKQLPQLATYGLQFQQPTNFHQDLLDLIQQFSKLNASAQVQVAGLLGSPRDFQSLSALLRNPAALSAAGQNYTDSGALQQRVASVNQTAGQSLERLKTAAETFAETLLNSGLGTLFIDLSRAGQDVLGFLGDLAKVGSELNRDFGGLPAEILGVVAGLRLLKAGLGGIQTLTGAKASTALEGSAGALNISAENLDAAALALKGSAVTGTGGGLIAGAEGGAAGGWLARLLGGAAPSLPAGVESGAVASRGLFGTALGAGVGEAGLGAGSAITGGGLLLAAGAGFAAYQGTTAALDAIFGKPKNVPTSTSLAPQAQDFIKNFQNTTQGRSLAGLVQNAGTPQQQAQYAADLQKAALARTGVGGFGGFFQGVQVNQDLLALYDQLISTSQGKGLVAPTSSLDQLIQNNPRQAQRVADQQYAQGQAQQAAQQRQAALATQLPTLPNLASQNFATVSDVQTAFQSGALTFTQSLQKMNDAIRVTPAGMERINQQLQEFAFVSQLATQNIANISTFGASLQGLNAAQISGQTQAAFAQQAPRLGLQDTLSVFGNIVQQIPAATQALINSQSSLQGLLNFGQAGQGAAFTAAAARRYNTSAAASTPGFVPVTAGPTALSSQDVTSIANAGQTYVQQYVAQQQAHFASANTLAQAQLQGDQQVLGFLQQEARAHPDIQPQIAAAQTKVYQDQVAYQQAQLQTIQAQAQYQQALNFVSPVAQAQIAINSANQQAQALGTSVQKLQSVPFASLNQQQQQILQNYAQGQQQLYQALQAQTQAQYSVLSSQFAITGNAPAQAQTGIQAAAAAIKQFQSKFPNQANLQNSTYAQLISNYNNAVANYLTTNISFVENLVSEQVTDNQISIGQAIAKLRGLQQEAIRASNWAAAEQIQTQIQQLINQGNQNASFNLPTNLNLPTLYEVRRTEGTKAGNTYYGNQGTVNLQVNIGGTNPQAAVNAIMQAVGGPPTTGFNPPSP